MPKLAMIAACACLVLGLAVGYGWSTLEGSPTARDHSSSRTDPAGTEGELGRSPGLTAHQIPAAGAPGDNVLSESARPGGSTGPSGTQKGSIEWNRLSSLVAKYSHDAASSPTGTIDGYASGSPEMNNALAMMAEFVRVQALAHSQSDAIDPAYDPDIYSGLAVSVLGAGLGLGKDDRAALEDKLRADMTAAFGDIDFSSTLPVVARRTRQQIQNEAMDWVRKRATRQGAWATRGLAILGLSSQLISGGSRQIITVPLADESDSSERPAESTAARAIVEGWTDLYALEPSQNAHARMCAQEMIHDAREFFRAQEQDREEPVGVSLDFIRGLASIQSRHEQRLAYHLRPEQIRKAHTRTYVRIDFVWKGELSVTNEPLGM